MSSLLLFAPFFAFISSVVIYYLVRFVVNRSGVAKFAKPISLIAAVSAFIPTTVLFFEQLPAAMTYSGRGVSAAEANSRLVMFKIPTTASNVDFRHAFFNGTTDAADFDIDETEFLQWMTDSRRQPDQFATTEKLAEWADGKSHRVHLPISVTPVSALLERHSGDRQIENGYYFDDSDRDRVDDSGLTIVYDSDQKRVYMWHTTF
jgi:hypothetical protein